MNRPLVKTVLLSLVTMVVVFALSGGRIALLKIFTDDKWVPVTPYLALALLSGLAMFLLAQAIIQLLIKSDVATRIAMAISVVLLMSGYTLAVIGWPMSTLHYRANKDTAFLRHLPDHSSVGTTYRHMRKIPTGTVVARFRLPEIFLRRTKKAPPITRRTRVVLVHYEMIVRHVDMDNFELIPPRHPPIYGAIMSGSGMLLLFVALIMIARTAMKEEPPSPPSLTFKGEGGPRGRYLPQ